MALNAASMKAAFQIRIMNGLQRVYSSEVNQGSGYAGISQQQWAMLADAISDIAIDLVLQMQTEAEVLPGQSVVTNTGAGSTVSPGKIT